MNDTVAIEESADRVVLRLNRPDARNAINLEIVRALHEACATLEQTPRVALIVGSGANFAAGADIQELRDRRHEDALSGINSRLFNRIRHLPMPVVALVDGFALGGGAELAYACDFRLGTPRVRIGNPEPGLGIVAAAGALWRLRDLVGEPLAKEILLAGRVLDAQAALQAGLLNQVVEPSELEDAGHQLVDRMISQSALALRLTKQLFHAPREAHPFIDDLAQAVLFETQDKQDRMTQFLERRKETT